MKYYLVCFVTTLNAAFKSKLALEDEGYESGSKNFNLTTPLRKSTKIHHVSSIENASFNPDPVTATSVQVPEKYTSDQYADA